MANLISPGTTSQASFPQAAALLLQSPPATSMDQTWNVWDNIRNTIKFAYKSYSKYNLL